MMSRSFGTVALLKSIPGSEFSISPLLLRKIPKILGILFKNKTCMEKNRQKNHKIIFINSLK